MRQHDPHGDRYVQIWTILGVTVALALGVAFFATNEPLTAVGAIVGLAWVAVVRLDWGRS